MRLPETAAERLNGFQGDADAGQDGALAIRMAFRVGNRNALGHKPRRLMMVGDGDLDAKFAQNAHLFFARDAAIDGDQEIGFRIHQAIDGCGGDGVALVEAARDKRRHASPERAQPPRHDRGGGNAVKIEIAEHHDVVAALDGGLKTVDDVGKPGNGVGVEPIALKRRREKPVRSFRGVDASCSQGGCDELRHMQLTLQNGDRLGVCCLDVESGRHMGT